MAKTGKYEKEEERACDHLGGSKVESPLTLEVLFSRQPSVVVKHQYHPSGTTAQGIGVQNSWGRGGGTALADPLDLHRRVGDVVPAQEAEHQLLPPLADEHRKGLGQAMALKYVWEGSG